jgi:predicted house-cleaning noncanonical NTP pyrophosphatase (MazG superfamily)
MSGKIFYNKLIRDGIPQKIKDNGGEFEMRTLKDDAEFQQELLKKVAEEANALARVRSRDEFLGEYADLMIVLDEIARLLEFSEADVKLALEENLKKKGGFKERLFLHWSSDDTYTSNETPQGIR